jgi:hypothetical protein
MNAILTFVTAHRTKFLVAVVLATSGFLLLWQEPQKPLRVAVAKGGRMQEMSAVLESAANQAVMRGLVLDDARVSILLDDIDYGFLYAYPLGLAEAEAWHEDGCDVDSCAQVTLYDFSEGGTIEVIVNIDKAEVIDLWVERDARPGASPYIIPRAMAAIAADRDMVELLGDVRSAESMMVPMSTWMLEGECKEDWCVDLTYASPDGSGKILHALVNMEKERVSRIFYTRGRPDRVYKRPAAQEANFNNGCHEQFGWSVCWQMTAHDGIDFFDAKFDDELVFSSAKISQVEVFYPSWPGGYRDEIGYAASVPPYFGTHVRELDDGFEVSQLYTEFLRWPNCICCYRYEQVIRFHANGNFEPIFISHGPGCDDLSNYRPFWRIDLDIGGKDNDEVWKWEGEIWEKADTEFTIPLFSDQAPDGGLVHFSAADVSYAWQPVATDPSGEDDGRLYVLRANEGEGDGPVPTGPADSFWPPGRWLDGESLSDEDVVIWYIPVLHTKKDDPWWCMPDPEPDFSPCDAVSILKRTGELVQPPTREATRTSTTEPEIQDGPLLTPTAAATMTPRSVLGEDPITIIESSGCGSCHAIGMLGEPGKVGPDLSNIGNLAASRIPGVSAEEYIRQAITDPGAYIAPSCPNGPCLASVMPRTYKESLSSEQLALLVAYLVDQKIELHDQDTGTSATPVPSVGQDSDSSSGDGEASIEQEDAGNKAPTFIIVAALTVILVILLAGIYKGIERQTGAD